MRSLFFKNLAIVFTSLLLFVGLLITPFSNVSAQSGQIDYTPKLNNLESQDPNAPKYADNRIIVKFKKDQSPLVLQEKVDEREEQRSSITGLLSQQITDVAYRIRGQELPEDQLGKLESFAQSQNVKGFSIFESVPETRETFVYEGVSQKSIDIEKLVVDFESLKEVAYAEPDYIGRLLLQPNDEFYGTQWNYPNIHADQAWDITKGDPNGSVLVAVLDSGITSDHPDLSSKIVAMYNCVSRNPCTINSGYDDNAYWDNGQYFEIYHGSHVSGTAAAITDNGLGVSGTGFNTKLISIKVADRYGDIYSTDLIRGLNVLVQSYSGSKIVINMSLGFTANSQSVHDAIQNAWNTGFVAVASAGNNGNSIPNYPAAYSEVISVAATDRNNAIAPYSNRGTWIDIAAPGGNCNSLATRQNCIMSTSKYNPLTGQHWYNYLAGTSMASPHVAGAAALVWAKYPSFTNTQVRNAIQSSADQISGTGTYWKYGKLNAAAALAPPAATSTPTPTFTPVPTSTPTLTPVPPTPSNSPTPTNTPTPTTTLTPTITPTPTTAPAPDLIVENIEVIDSQTGPLDTYDIMVTIKNQGEAVAGFHRNYLYLNPVDIPPVLTTGETSTGTRSDNIPAGGSYVWGVIENTFDQTDYVIYAWTNRDEGLVESDYDNNQLRIDFTVPDPTETVMPTATPTPVDACPLFSSGDATCDGVINSADYGVWYTEYFCEINGESNCMTEADFDSNGVVNLFDFTILISGIRYSSSN